MTNPTQLSRRALLGAGIATAAAAGLTACTFSSGGGSSGSPGRSSSSLTFWDMVWGTGADYTARARKTTAAYHPGSGPDVRYQSIPWANWYQTFTSAAASKTTPAVSTGAAFLPFYFLESGAVTPADDLVDRLESSGKNDFLPGLLDSMKTSKGYAAVPWSLDLRVLWYRKSLLEDAGADVPTDWDSFVRAGTSLQKKGVTGLGLAAGSTTTDAQHTIAALMINNGGGLFDADANPDAVTERNIETLDFLHELVAKKIIDPNAASYSADNLSNDWTKGRIGMGFNQTGLDKSAPAADRSDFVVADPITGPHGDTGTVYYVNPLMMFPTTPSQEASEAFVAWYLDNMHVFWESGVETDLPAKKSIADLPVIQGNPNLVTSVDKWQPIGKTIGAKTDHAFGDLNAVDGGSATAAFVQETVQGEKSSKSILEGLQTQLEKVVK